MTLRHLGLLGLLTLVLWSMPARAQHTCDDVGAWVDGWIEVRALVYELDPQVSDAEHEALAQALGPMYSWSRALAIDLTTRHDSALVALGHQILDGFSELHHAPDRVRAGYALDKVIAALEIIEARCRHGEAW